MVDFSIKTTASGLKVDTRWRVSKHGESNARPGQLDVSTLTATVGLVNAGYIPSGTALGKVTATGLWAIYNAAASDGTEVLAGFLNDDDGVETDGTTDVPAAILVHGIIDASKLPVTAQRTSVLTADQSGSFVFVTA